MFTHYLHSRRTGQDEQATYTELLDQAKAVSWPTAPTDPQSVEWVSARHRTSSAAGARTRAAVPHQTAATAVSPSETLAGPSLAESLDEGAPPATLGYLQLPAVLADDVVSDRNSKQPAFRQGTSSCSDER